MRISYAAIFTLATLATSNVTQQATAAPTNDSPQNQTTTNVVVQTTEVTSTQTNAIASPETVTVSQFSQNNNLVVTATDVQVVGATPELQQIISKIIKTQVGGETSQTQLQQDVAAILDTGLFANVSVNSQSTKAGLNVVYQVQPIIVRSLQFPGAKVLNYQEALKPFQSLVGKPISPANLQQAVQQINQWYADNGDKVARVLSITPSREGILSVNITDPEDRDRKITPFDAQGNPLSFSGTGIDDLTTVSFSAGKDNRDHPTNPTQGSVLRLQTEQSISIGKGEISINRLEANYSRFVPIKLFDSQQPQVFAVNLQAGTVIGDSASQKKFNLGGSNSVRGYDSGQLGNSRSYVLASAEYRFPVWQNFGGVLFGDFASNLGSGDTVLGNPAGVHGKPGIGFGYGAGIRFNSPLGLLRADYGINDQGESKFHFGIGQRF
ncbi:BamA/TamA family outer membrane protein [Pelatocladus sp. BLCC-F211]|uniref:BamA/TamA family outer membrane protein n=1 Tax=Pelatocladus sp. BLCC-F211 TaxID=3342752 RepID=UPI0035BA70D9